MKIQLTNSLIKKKEEFRPIKNGQVGLYSCGPTVYDYPHIGNLRAYLVWDILKRFLVAQDYEVTHIMNITDVGHLTSDADSGEDKMQTAAKREGKDAWQIAEFFIKVFKDNLDALDILEPTKFVRATDTIEEQIEFVKILEEKEFVYKISDGLYFDTSKLKNYGQLANIQNIDLKEGARVEKNPDKKNPTDFAVWKFSPQDSKRDMEWDSPWGKGFPGWHLECSVMSQIFLGDTFDIHAGGVDHLPVHHPNEMAQSEAATGKLQANFWLHNEFLKFESGKMSKSAGTFITLDDLKTKGFAPVVFRFFTLQAHYRKSLNFSWEAIEAAKSGLANIIKEIVLFDEADKKIDAALMEKFEQAMADDLNTPQALAVLQELLGADLPTNTKLATIYKMDEILGLDLANLRKQALEIPKEAKDLLAQREQARVDKDWGLSDALRDRLQKMNVEVVDTAKGQKAVKIEL